jgi:hypothetical protein
LEPDRVRERYGRNSWGQRCLLGRRLVEAGVDLVSVTLNGSLCGRVNNWDDHAVNHHVFEAMKYRAPFFDQAVAALIEDLHERGLDRRVLLPSDALLVPRPRPTSGCSRAPWSHRPWGVGPTRRS